jgi:ribose transport system ATP-binding protein
VSKAFGGSPALVNFDLEIESGQVHALVGGNGSGKSTFIKILAGYHKADSGTMEIGGHPLRSGRNGVGQHTGCHFVHQDLGLVNGLTIAENLFLASRFPTRLLAIRRQDMARRATWMTKAVGLDVPPDTKVGDLSQSQKTLVAVARAMNYEDSEPIRLVVFDEPTATLPSNDVAVLSDVVRRLTQAGVAVLYVTHRLDEIFELADVVTVLRDGVSQGCSRISDITHSELVNLLVGGVFDSRSVADEVQIDAQSTSLLGVRDLYTKELRGVSFDVSAGEILGIAGITGSGRETILGSIFNPARVDRGTISVEGEVLAKGSARNSLANGIAYLPPDRKLLGGFMDLSARYNLTLPNLRPFWSTGFLHKKLEVDDARRWFDALQVLPFDGGERKLGTFSGGNQQKILLAKWLRNKPRVLLVAEPTQGVDVAAKVRLHESIREAARSGSAVVVSSSDVDELFALCSRVLVIRDGRIAKLLKGDGLTSAAIEAECVRIDETAA